MQAQQILGTQRFELGYRQPRTIAGKKRLLNYVSNHVVFRAVVVQHPRLRKAMAMRASERMCAARAIATGAAWNLRPGLLGLGWSAPPACSVPDTGHVHRSPVLSCVSRGTAGRS